MQGAAVAPGLLHGVVDAEMEVAAVAVGIVAGGTGGDVEVEAAALDRVVFAGDVADHIVMRLIEPHPRGDREILVSKGKSGVMLHLDAIVHPVETGSRTGFARPARRRKVHAMRTSVVLVPGVIPGVSGEFPVAYQPVFQRIRLHVRVTACFG